MYIYIYMYTHTYTYIHTCVFSLSLSIYIYIYNKLAKGTLPHLALRARRENDVEADLGRADGVSMLLII